ncbi:MAG: YicC family protein [Candidatus Omnitrophica bacterium]|nr:YicC family protein [Candidatus Omnitrophota bacterium]
MGIKHAKHEKQDKREQKGKTDNATIKSMTGFGAGSVQTPYGAITAEIKTLNHKHLSIASTPFEGIFLLEERLREVIEKRVLRGKVFVKIVRDAANQERPIKEVFINDNLVSVYLKKFREMQKKYSLDGNLKISDIINLPGVIEQDKDNREETMWPHIKKATLIALDELMCYRVKEGEKLAKDLAKRVTLMNTALENIKKYAKESIEEYRGKISAKMSEAADNKRNTDNVRIEEEVALFARNCDISEEVVRLGNHIEAYEECLKKVKCDVGKKLDFIAQEMHREINTIGAKANDYRIANLVIEIKSEIEKSREQLKNIE